MYKYSQGHAAYLVHRVDDPVDSWITANGFVLRINENDFEVFVCRVLIDPVRIEDPKISTSTTDTLFSGRLE